MPNCHDASAPPGVASFVMAPYSNRIRDGRFVFRGTTIQLTNVERHAIHGAVRKLPWETIDVSESSLSCRLKSSDHADFNWPWPISVEQHVSLDGKSLSSLVRLHNHGDTAMPYGIGWHPYFIRNIDGVAPSVELPVSAVYPDASGDCLPDGAAVPLPDDLDYRVLRTLDPDRHIDHCFAGLENPIRLSWPGTGIGLNMHFSENCDHLVVFNPSGANHFAIEPVSNANDAFNLAEQGIPAGRRVLEPGATAEACLELLLD